MVGILCSKIRPSQLPRALDDEFVTDFRHFLFATSMAYGCWSGRGISHGDLCRAAHRAGFKVVQRLDRILSPQFMAKCSRETSQMLLLIVLGISLGVGYSAHLTHSPSFPRDLLGSQFQESPTLWLTMKEHLCQMLAHHLIFLGSTLGIKLNTGIEQRIIDSAVNRWDKLEVNVWAEVLGQLPPEPDEPVKAEEEEAGHARPREPPLMAIACPELMAWARLPVQDENPQSYLAMADEVPPGSPRSSPYGPEPSEPLANDPRSLPHGRYWVCRIIQADGGCFQFVVDVLTLLLLGTAVPFRQVKHRSVWLVRPLGTRPQEMVNVHTRLRIWEGQTVGQFV